MITIYEETNLDIVKSIITVPKLFYKTYGQDTKISDFNVNPEFKYLVFKDENEILGCVMIKEWTHLVLEVHIFILPKYWGQKEILDCVSIGHNWIKQQGYTKTFTRVPSNCTHVLRLLEKIKYKCCGMIENGIIYNKKLVNLFLFEFEV